MERGRPDTTDLGYADVERGRRMVHSSRTRGPVPSRCQEFSWLRSIGGASGERKGQTPDCAAMEGARTVGSGEEGGGASGVKCLPQKNYCKSRSAW